MPKILDDLKDKKIAPFNQFICVALVLSNGLLMGLIFHQNTPILTYLAYILTAPFIVTSVFGTLLFILGALLSFFGFLDSSLSLISWMLEKSFLDIILLFSIVAFVILLSLFVVGVNFDWPLG